ncbi:nose resistant to fluoxetine protein 6-like [Nymphalis io]|uniref:nose resistant to fluoxetine protein 6-like n=1 Tax=Inachis io TaxID=171585 RepID=UPI0021694CAE|nr:nose resistant to fluoxetine protein 6-like [Nymphalis io]
MRHITVAIVIYLNIILTSGNVTSSTKNGDLTTSIPLENRAQNVSNIKPSEKKKESMKTFNLNDSPVYLDDVLFILKNQNWTEEEQPCLRTTLLLLHNLQNFTLWAVWNWDAISSEPQGLLFGSRFHLGNFDECTSAPWYKTQPELRTQYCLADIVLERTDKLVKKRIFDPYDPYQSALNLLEYRSVFRRPLNELTWGVCVPAVCQPKSVERLMGILLAHSHLGTAGLRPRISVTEPCQKIDEPLAFDALFYAFIGVMGSLTILVLACTFIKHKKKDFNYDKIQDNIIIAFDIKTNATNLLKISGDGLEVLYGIKFLTMCVIVSAHQYGIFNGGPVSNGSKMDEDVLTILGMMFLHEDIVVDSFFLLSGFLVATVLIKTKKLPNLLFLFIKRYVRLVVAYAVVVFYVCAVFPYTGSGPLWHRAIAADTEPCRKNWWLSLLMLSNYIDSQNICLVVSWYIPCDFHFFILTVTLYWFYKKYPLAGKILTSVVTIAAILAPGIINYIYKLPAIQLFTYDFITNPRGPLQFHMTYIKSHTRYAAYLIGFFSGYLYIYCAASENFNKISKKWSILGACLSIFTMGVVMFTGPMFLWRSYDVLESAIYAALNRPVWASSVALLVMCLSLGRVPLIKAFLSWYPWVPLSRLSYGLYLIHTVFIARNVYVTRNPQHHDYINIMTYCLGIICEGCLAALLIWLIVEAPINNLLNIIFKFSNNREKETNIERHSSTNGGNDKTTNCGYLQENIPTSVQIISSKI